MPLDPETRELVDRFNRRVVNRLRGDFVDKDEIIELMAICAIAQEHLLIVGPPGTAKSQVVRNFGQLVGTTSGTFFRYLLTRFTEPNEIFGPVNIKLLQERGVFQRNIRNMLPDAEIAFLDEVFKANSAILNALLTILNERVYHVGAGAGEPASGDGSQPAAGSGGDNHRAEIRVPLLTAFGATNEIPEDESLAALFDRFVVRVYTENVDERHLTSLLNLGWRMERKEFIDTPLTREDVAQRDTLDAVQPEITTDGLRRLHSALQGIDVTPVTGQYRTLLQDIRAEGITISDRRAIKMLKMVAASALRAQRDHAEVGDFWVLRHIWNDVSQVQTLRELVDQTMSRHGWTPEVQARPLQDIVADLRVYEARIPELERGTQRLQALRELNHLRNELEEHPDNAQEPNPVLEHLTRADEMIQEIVAQMENPQS